MTVAQEEGAAVYWEPKRLCVRETEGIFDSSSLIHSGLVRSICWQHGLHSLFVALLTPVTPTKRPSICPSRCF